MIAPSGSGSHPVIAAIHANAQNPAKYLCRNMALLSGGTYWVVCPWGAHDGGPYPYYVFGSSAHAERKILRGLTGLRRAYPNRLLEPGVLVGENDGAVLATRIAGRRGSMFPRLVLIIRNKGALLSSKGLRVWAPQDLQSFASDGGQSVLYIIKNCKTNAGWPPRADTCEAADLLKIKCEQLNLEEDVILSVGEFGDVKFPDDFVRRFREHLRPR